MVKTAAFGIFPGPGDHAPNPELVDPLTGSRTLEDVLAASAPLPVLLAFFKTSCPTCRLSWPYMQKIHAIYGGKGVRVVGVSQNDAASARKFYSDQGGATFDLLLDPEPAFAASNAFGIESVPHLVLVSSQRKVERAFAGWQRKAIEELGDTIADLAGLERAPVVLAEDPIAPWKAG